MKEMGKKGGVKEMGGGSGCEGDGEEGWVSGR